MMMIIILIKFILMFKIQMKQNINILLKDNKTLVLKSMKIQSFLLSIQIICRMSIKVLKTLTQIVNVKYQMSLMIWLLVWLATQNMNSNWTIRGRKLNISTAFIAQSYFTKRCTKRCWTKLYTSFILKTPSK